MGLIAMSERDLQRIEILSKVTAGRFRISVAIAAAERALTLSPWL
jgi:hypothetical protein